MSVQLSPDGLYYWDGSRWLSTLSHDGRARWNGSQWLPAQGQAYVPSANVLPPRTREPTSWTRPLQYAVAGWCTLSAIYSLSLPFWMGGLMTQMINASIQRQQDLNPSATPLPADFSSTMETIVTVSIWAGAAIGVAVFAVIAIGALKRWTWLYYVVLVFLGLGAISLPIDIVDAVTGSSMSAASGFTMPSQFYWFGVLSSIPGTALFVWMLVGLVRRGPWAMRRPQPVS